MMANEEHPLKPERGGAQLSRLDTLLKFYDLYRRENIHEWGLLNGRMTWYFTSQSFLMLAVAITYSGTGGAFRDHVIRTVLPVVFVALGIATSYYMKQSVDGGCEIIHRWKYPEAIVWRLLSPYLIRRRQQPIRLNDTDFPSDTVHESSMKFLYYSPSCFLFAWFLLAECCLYYSLYPSHTYLAMPSMVALAIVLALIGWMSRQSTPHAKRGRLTDERWKGHTITSVLPQQLKPKEKEDIIAKLKDKRIELPADYVTLMDECDGLVVDNCHILGLSDARHCPNIDNKFYYQLAEIAGTGALYVRQEDKQNLYLIRYSAEHADDLETTDFRSVVEQRLRSPLQALSDWQL
jgi:hypothetical protein